MAEPVRKLPAYRRRSGPGRAGALAELATRQEGVVGRQQLLRLGFTSSSIQRLITAKHLHGLHDGVYAVGHPVVSVRGRWIAALIAGGPGAVLSHGTAAAVWDLRESVGSQIHVTAGRGHGPRAGIRFHRAGSMHPEDRTRRAGLPVTSVARLMLDLAADTPPPQLGRLVERTERLRLYDALAIERVLSRAGGHRGRRPLRQVIGRQAGPPPDTRSNLERRFLDLCVQGSLPRPALNVTVAGFEVDAVWLAERLVVELDGYAFHRTRRTFEADRIRDAALQLAGYRVLRITHRRLDSEPAAVLEAVRTLLAEARACSATSSGR